jgi:hypothetical protein
MDIPLPMAFLKIGPNAAESDTGFRVERTGRMELRYTERGRSLVIEVEPGDGLAVYQSTIRGWQPPHDAEMLNSADRARVVSNVVAALRFLGVDFVLE